MITDTDKLKPFAELVSRMRQAQRIYFATRSRESLIEAKRLEQSVDRWLVDHAEVTSEQSG